MAKPKSTFEDRLVELTAALLFLAFLVAGEWVYAREDCLAEAGSVSVAPIV